MNLQKVNECRQSGNIAHVDIRNGTHGPYGTIGVIIDDGYFKKGNNNQKGEWIDRSYYVEFKVGSSALKNTDTLNKGDYVFIESKLVEEKWEDRNSGQPRSALKLEAKRIVIHMARSDIKGIQGRNNQNSNNNQQGGGQYQQQRPQGNSQGGYQQGGGYQHGGGYNNRSNNQQSSNVPQNEPHGHEGNNQSGYQQRAPRSGGGYQQNYQN